MELSDILPFVSLCCPLRGSENSVNTNTATRQKVALEMLWNINPS
jgi:hypothetical protein